MKAFETPFAAVIAILVTLPFASFADHIPGLYNTGVNDDTSLVTPGYWESHYTLTYGTNPPQAPRTIVGGTGSMAGKHSLAISVGDTPWTYPTGVYLFRTTFNMTGLNTNKAQLRGLWRTWGAAQMRLNNLPVDSYPAGGGFPSLLPFSVSAGFVDGTNILDFIVTNDSGYLLLEVDAIQGTALPVGIGYRTIPDLRDTGTLAGGALLPTRSYTNFPDVAYQLISAPAGATVGPALVKFENDVETGYYYANGPYAQWIFAKTTGGIPLGRYHYRHTFNMTGLLPATAKIDGWCAGDGDVQILLNGVSATNIFARAEVARTYFAATNGFASGWNTLDFILTNGAAPFTAALLVEGLQGSALLDTNSPIVGIRVSQVELAWDSATNVVYQVQYRSSLTTNEWTNYGGPIAGVDGIIRVTVPVLGDQSFYRLILP